jgi:hypothetical protein
LPVTLACPVLPSTSRTAEYMYYVHIYLHKVYQ